MPHPSIKQIANVFFRIGNTTFGGGLVTINVLGRELVHRRSWISASDYELAFAVARVTPGTSIIAFCAAAGWLVLGWAGAIAAVMALTVPSAVLAILLLSVLDSGASHPLVMGVLEACVAAVAGMMGAVVLIIVQAVFQRPPAAAADRPHRRGRVSGVVEVPTSIRCGFWQRQRSPACVGPAGTKAP